MDDVTLARAVHVLSVVHWLGGMAFVTLVVLPLARQMADPAQRLTVFLAAEQRFSLQVKVSLLLVGASGLYMAERLAAWPRFLDLTQWWLSAMAALWALFMTILFVVEPVFGARFLARGDADPDGTLRLLQRAHWFLLALSALVAGAAVLGTHGMLG